MDSFSSPPTTPTRRPTVTVDVDRPNSPSPSTSGFSLIAPDEADESDFWTYNNSSRRPAFHSTPALLTYFSSPSSATSSSSYAHLPSFTTSPNSSGNGGLKSLLPRIWDVLVSSPTRNMLNSSPTENRRQRAHTIYGTYPRVKPSQSSVATLVPFPTSNTSSSANDPFSSDFEVTLQSLSNGSSYHRPSLTSINSFSSSSFTHVEYSDLAPLDGEEGELIDVDDEACFPFPSSAHHSEGRLNLAFICKYNCKYACTHPLTWKPVPKTSFSRARVVTGIDIVGLLPVELGLEILIYLATPSAGLEDILTCTAVSKTWRSLALDNAVWKKLFEGKWGVGRITRDERKLRRYLKSQRTTTRRSREKRLPPIPGSEDHDDDEIQSLNYLSIYQDRLELDRRWAGTAFTKRVISMPPTSYPYPRPHRISPSPSTSSSSTFLPISASTSTASSVYNSLESSPASTIHPPLPGTYPHSRNPSPHRPHTPSMTPLYGGAYRGSGLGEECFQYDKFEPGCMNLEGHTDSVYCVEFAQGGTVDHDEYILTGSRDKTVKMWNLTRGRCVGTFRGHGGSVLCLKFFWLSARHGIMYSGSSDRTISIWDVWLEGRHGQAKAKVTTILRGHGGGVLDLRVDDRWVVSCSKDAAIRIWRRESIVPDEEGYGPEPYHILEGHQGPVNAVGLENGHVISASGDGKMILWEVESGTRLKTFAGHDRGLACIAFKDNFIVTGSNDHKIKIWSAETGKCVCTLEGHESLVRALSFDTVRGLLVSASYDKSVRVWDVGDVIRGNSETPRAQLVREFRHTHTSHIFDVKFDYGRIVSTSHDRKIIVADFTKGLDSIGLFV